MTYVCHLTDLEVRKYCIIYTYILSGEKLRKARAEAVANGRRKAFPQA